MLNEFVPRARERGRRSIRRPCVVEAKAPCPRLGPASYARLCDSGGLPNRDLAGWVGPSRIFGTGAARRNVWPPPAGGPANHGASKQGKRKTSFQKRHLIGHLIALSSPKWQSWAQIIVVDVGGLKRV